MLPARIQLIGTMILNAYSLLDGFVALLRLALSILMIGLALWNWSLLCGSKGRQACERRENRGYLVLQLAVLLMILNGLSWPLLYLLLHSYVPEWPGVMCIYGVTQVGAGSHGASRFLPPLLLALQVLKPALVFGSGAWGILYLLNRRTVTSPLMGRILLTLVGVGALAFLDAGLEITYLAIPKQEDYLSIGCCTGTLAEQENRFLPAAVTSEARRPWLTVGNYAAHGIMIVGVLACLRGLRVGLPVRRMSCAGATALAAVPIYAVFLVDVAAPAWLRLPLHHCAYDLIERAPEALAGVASFVVGTFAVGWACVSVWLGRGPETTPILHEFVRKLLVAAWFGYIGSLVTISVGLALAGKAVAP